MGFFKKTLNKVIKPFQKISDKIIPNELRPLLPYASMFIPGSGILGAMGGPAGFAKMYGANMLTQAMSDPEAEFGDLNQLSGILSGLQGGLSGPNTGNSLRAGTTEGQATLGQIQNAMPGTPAADFATQQANIGEALSNRGILTKASDLGRQGLGAAADYLSGNINTLQDVGSGRVDLFDLENAKNAAKAIAPQFAQATGDVAVNYQRPTMREFERVKAEEEADIERTSTANDSKRADYQMTFMRQAGIPEVEIKETLVMNDLEEYYSPPETETAAYGGLMGRNDYEFGGIIDAIKNIESREMMNQNKNMGGMMNGYNMGGSVLPQGMEMDYRQGGFIPMGSKERADDVPARVSKNEFVMTADAVRAAGGGSVNEGARKMYNLMNNLEAKA